MGVRTVNVAIRIQFHKTCNAPIDDRQEGHFEIEAFCPMTVVGRRWRPRFLLFQCVHQCVDGVDRRVKQIRNLCRPVGCIGSDVPVLLDVASTICQEIFRPVTL